MRNAHGVVFVFDVTSPTGLQGLKTVFTAIEEEIKPDTQVILCANKIDLVDPELDLTDFALWAEVHRMDFMKTSAQTGEGITNLFTHMAILINENCLENRKLRMDSVVNDICVGEPTEPAQKGCC
jgi:50S ribosomal subunit-associated GTPase HflX